MYLRLNVLAATSGGAVNLYFNNSKKIETTSGGATITGTVTADGVRVGDDESIELGDSQEFTLQHTGSGNSIICETGSGNLYIDATKKSEECLTKSQNTLEAIAEHISD